MRLMFYILTTGSREGSMRLMLNINHTREQGGLYAPHDQPFTHGSMEGSMRLILYILTLGRMEGSLRLICLPFSQRR